MHFHITERLSVIFRNDQSHFELCPSEGAPPVWGKAADHAGHQQLGAACPAPTRAAMPPGRRLRRPRPLSSDGPPKCGSPRPRRDRMPPPRLLQRAPGSGRRPIGRRGARSRCDPRNTRSFRGPEQCTPCSTPGARDDARRRRRSWTNLRSLRNRQHPRIARYAQIWPSPDQRAGGLVYSVPPPSAVEVDGHCGQHCSDRVPHIPPALCCGGGEVGPKLLLGFTLLP